MNVKRFTAPTARDALALVREAFGDDAVVISTRPNGANVDVFAMAPDSAQQFEDMAQADAAERLPAAKAQRPASSVEEDVQQLSMSTLSFQDYVRERMLKRRKAEMTRSAAPAPKIDAVPKAPREERTEAAEPPLPLTSIKAAPPAARVIEEPPRPERAAPAPLPPRALPRRDDVDVMGELRSMRGLIEQRFGALAFMEKLQRQPRQALLSQKLLEHGFSPALTRKLIDGLPDDVDEASWAAEVLERNLASADAEPALEEQGGVYALIGSTGVGKTTSTAKLAAAFASRHGAANLGLITLDAYRIAAHEQLRTYGRILGVPVHTAHDRASLEDLLDLLSAKKMVLIDTAGTAQRDERTRELLEMLSHPSINRVLVINAAAQGETIDDVLVSYRAATCKGVILSKLDEAVKLAPALDALIRHRLTVLAVANGQRVPEDWHRLSAQALVQRALKGGGSPAWRLDANDVALLFTGLPAAAPASASTHAHV